MLRERLSGMIAEWRLSMLLAGERVSEVMDAQFPSASGIAQLRGIVHAPSGPKPAFGTPPARRTARRILLSGGAAGAVGSKGIWGLRFNFRSVDANGKARRDLS